jgi:hypothetical protein
VRAAAESAGATQQNDREIEPPSEEQTPPTRAAAAAASPKRKGRADARQLAEDADDKPARGKADDRSARTTAVARAEGRRGTRVADDDSPRGRQQAGGADDRRRSPGSRRVANDDDRDERAVPSRAPIGVTRVTVVEPRGSATSGRKAERLAKRSGRGAADGDADPRLPPPGRFTVQLGPYRNRKDVELARADLSRRGYEARVVGQSLQLGNFAEKGRAERLASRLRVSGHPATSAALR